MTAQKTLRNVLQILDFMRVSRSFSCIFKTYFVLFTVFLGIKISTGADPCLYNATDDGGLKWQCKKCNPGFYFVEDCIHGYLNSTTCDDCPRGRFLAKCSISKKCRECHSHCRGVNEVQHKPCGPTTDLVCGCNSGFFHDNAENPSMSKCLPYQLCDKGLGVVMPLPPDQDLKCVPCIKGTNYSDVKSWNATCQPCSNCSAEGWKEISPCSVFKNAQCDVKTTTLPPSATHSTASGATTSTPTPEETMKLGGALIFLLIFLILAGAALLMYMYKYRKSLSQRLCGILRRGQDGVNLLGVHWRRAPQPQVNEFSKGVYRPPCLQLKEGVQLQPDVFVWVGSHFGMDSYRNFFISLNGIKLTAAVLDEPTNQRMSIDDGTTYLLDQWREANAEDVFNDDQVLNIIYEAMKTVGKHELAEDLRREFAKNPENAVYNISGSVVA